MWFESDKMYYEAIVKSHVADSTYNIFWVKEQSEEPMDLNEADNTEDTNNEDRWSILPYTEPVYRVYLCFFLHFIIFLTLPLDSEACFLKERVLCF